MLENSQIKLRALEPEDIDILYDIENNTDIWTVSNTLFPYSRDLLKRYIENAHQDIYVAKQLRMTIVLKEEKNIPVGFVDLYDFDSYAMKAGVGIVISPYFQKRGLASQTIELLKEYALVYLRLHQIYAEIQEDNKISIQLFQNKGFEVQGIKKDWSIKKGKYINHVFLQLLNV